MTEVLKACNEHDCSEIDLDDAEVFPHAVQPSNPHGASLPQGVQYTQKDNLGQGEEVVQGEEFDPYENVGHANSDIWKLSKRDLKARYPDLYRFTHKNWDNMKQRAKAKGIPVGDELQTFECFLKVLGFRPYPSATVDRIESTKGYYPGNVRWADKQTQTWNKSNTVLLPYQGEMLPLSTVATLTNQSRSTLYHRLAAGWLRENVVSGVPPFAPPSASVWSHTPWPQGREVAWERLYRERGIHSKGESREAFFYRTAKEQFNHWSEKIKDYGEVVYDDEGNCSYAEPPDYMTVEIYKWGRYLELAVKRHQELTPWRH